MEYSKIIAITGLPGLFELISSKSDGGIVRSLDDKSTRFVSSRVHQFSHLESIEVYTTRHNVNLVDILKAMESSKEKIPDDKEATELKSYFEKVYPELDFDRVYTSDLKKMVKWFSVLSKNQVEIKLSDPAIEEPVEETPAPVVKEIKSAKKTASLGLKTEAKLKEEKEAKSTEEKKPVKKSPEPKATEIKSSKKEKEKKEPVAKKPAKKTTPKKAESKPAKKSAAKPAAKKPASKKK
jgi:Domain of unknown function (DUF5606)